MLVHSEILSSHSTKWKIWKLIVLWHGNEHDKFKCESKKHSKMENIARTQEIYIAESVKETTSKRKNCVVEQILSISLKYHISNKNIYALRSIVINLVVMEKRNDASRTLHDDSHLTHNRTRRWTISSILNCRIWMSAKNALHERVHVSCSVKFENCNSFAECTVICDTHQFYFLSTLSHSKWSVVNG